MNRSETGTVRTRALWTWLRSGVDPDPRFTLANERTFLAWMRTSTAFIASGLGVEAFGGDVLASSVRIALAALLLLTGAVTATVAFVHWIRAERALRLGRSLPMPWMAPVVGVVLVVCALVLIVEIVQ
ncbi:YidH family protein [Rhodococcus sp. NPDC057297]|uniref:YidH family protein n=1 Tax=Rhodococcus sp. NPDC057297 TaxID=3346090 RepID=UPI00362F54B3